MFRTVRLSVDHEDDAAHTSALTVVYDDRALLWASEVRSSRRAPRLF
jgi:hypothetical protein